MESVDKERLVAILSLHQDLAKAEFDIDDIVVWLVDRARVLFGDSEASLGLIEGDHIVYQIVTRATRNLITGNSAPLDHSIGGICVRTGQTMVCDDSEADPRANVAACRRAGLRSMVLVPLRHGEKIVGVLNVNSSKTYAYTPAEVAIVELVGSVVSAAYSHAADLAAKRSLLAELQATVHALKVSEARLAHDVLHDPLTGLANRTLFMDRADVALRRNQRDGRQTAIFFVDVDRFKAVNDSFGHDAGDSLLVEVGARLTACLRPGDTAARFGGDEFTVLCENVQGYADALAIAGRIAETLGKRVELPGGELFPTVSVGVALSDDVPHTAESLLKSADVALYLAKQGGRNRVEVFKGGGLPQASRLSLENDLRHALASQQFLLVYQPQYSLSASAEVVGVEALLRWQHPEFGLLSPGQFLDIANETAMIVDIGRWVLTQACRQARRWQDMTSQFFSVAVNMSDRELGTPDLVTVVEETLSSADLAPERLCIEVLESVLVTDESAVQRNLLALGRLGVRLDIDDFGVGYSSFGQLTRFPATSLKIDKSLVDRVQDEDAIVIAVIGMAHALGLKVLAEGVETERQRDTLQELGCDIAQGHAFSKPILATEIDALLSRPQSDRLELRRRPPRAVPLAANRSTSSSSAR